MIFPTVFIPQIQLITKSCQPSMSVQAPHPSEPILFHVLKCLPTKNIFHLNSFFNGCFPKTQISLFKALHGSPLP